MIALQLDSSAKSLLALWSRDVAADVELPGLHGRTLEQAYPTVLPQWKIRVDGGTPVVQVPAGPGARVFTVR